MIAAKRSWFCAGVVLAVAACSDSDPSSTRITSPHRTMAPPVSLHAAAVVTYDDKLAAIAEREPAFGGMYNDNGVLTVVLVDTTRPLETVRSAITGVLGAARLNSMPIRARRGEYSFTQLYAWGKNLPPLFSIDGVISTDLDEAKNRITVGVRDGAVEASVRAVLTKAGVPSGAVDVFVRAPLRTMSSLSDRIRNTMGGLHLDWGTGGNWCTLGFNGSYGSQAVLATNGHCSYDWGTSADGTPYYQKDHSTSGDHVGIEGTESALFSSSTDARCSYNYDNCKWSDLTLAVYDSAVAQYGVVGYIGRPSTRSRFDSSLVLSDSWWLPVTDKALWPAQGDTVDKVGARTGWTHGPVTTTCENVSVYDAYSNTSHQFICQYEAELGNGPGDSGSSVFFYDAANGYATIVGQFFAGGNQSGSWNHLAVFSTVNNIQAEFGLIKMTVWGWY
jgi:hypothetical protein